MAIGFYDKFLPQIQFMIRGCKRSKVAHSCKELFEGLDGIQKQGFLSYDK
jgi:hypothetical protein